MKDGKEIDSADTPNECTINIADLGAVLLDRPCDICKTNTLIEFSGKVRCLTCLNDQEPQPADLS